MTLKLLAWKIINLTAFERTYRHLLWQRVTFTLFKCPNGVLAVCVRLMFISGQWGRFPFTWPHFNSRRHRKAIHQAVGRGRLPAAHKCMEQAIKLTLCQLFSHTSDGPLAAHPLPQGYSRSQEQMCRRWWASGSDALKHPSRWSRDIAHKIYRKRSGSNSALVWNLVRRLLTT